MRTIKAVTFDCYGTLIDWEGGLGTFLYDLARRCGDPEPPSGQELRARWEAIQFEKISGEYRSYEEVIAGSLRKWCAQHGHRWNEREGEALEQAMQAWQPFPDTIGALRAAREAGLRLAIASNTDRHIIEHTLRQLDGVEFDAVVVAEDVRSYKPAEPHFERVLDELDLPAGEVLHVAFGFKYDITTAARLGFQTAWVNRRREPLPPGAQPDHEWTDLWPLASVPTLTQRSG